MMRTKMLLLVLSLLLAPMLVRAEGFGSLSPQQVAAKLKEKNVYVFDNNSPDVFKAGHVPHAKWLHPSEYDAKELPSDKNAMLIFYCHNEH
jgi:hypothetical protein